MDANHVTLTIDGAEYAVGKIDPFQAFHVMRRLLPVLASIGASLSADEAHALMTGGDEDAGSALMRSMGAVAGVVATMPNPEVDYVMQTCLSAVRRHDAGTWAPILTGGKFMYQDIGVDVMLQLVVASLRLNKVLAFFGRPRGEAG